MPHVSEEDGWPASGAVCRDLYPDLGEPYPEDGVDMRMSFWRSDFRPSAQRRSEMRSATAYSHRLRWDSRWQQLGSANSRAKQPLQIFRIVGDEIDGSLRWT